MDTMHDVPGLPGLFVAGIFSGSLSTVSSAVNSLAAVTIHDYVKVVCVAGRTDEWEVPLTKLLSLLYGLLCLGVAYLVSQLGKSVLTASLTIFGAVGGPLLGVFTLGMFTTGGTQRGALVGLLTSLVFTLWISFAPKPPPTTLPVTTALCGHNATNIPAVVTPEDEYDVVETLYNGTAAVVEPSALEDASPTSAAAADPESYFYLVRISYMWISMLGFVIALLVGWLTSHWPARQRVHPDLLSPPRAWLARLFQADHPSHGSPSRQKLNGIDQMIDLEEFDGKPRGGVVYQEEFEGKTRM